MLTPGIIPNKEPMIRLGLILPEDDIKSIHISFSDSQCFEIEIIIQKLDNCIISLSKNCTLNS